MRELKAIFTSQGEREKEEGEFITWLRERERRERREREEREKREKREKRERERERERRRANNARFTFHKSFLPRSVPTEQGYICLDNGF